jgi:transcriptional regulator with XRE-family HTH domain
MAENRDNPVKALRSELGWNQTKLATELGMSIASIQNYERGMTPSAEAIRKMQTLAAAHGLEKIGFDLAPRAHSVAKVFTPADRSRPRLPKVSSGKDLGDSMHETLDLIIESGDADLVGFIESGLQAAKRLLEGKPETRRSLK